MIDCSNLSVDDQIDKFSKAKNVIIVHGASITNLLFVPNKINVIEIRSNIDGEFTTKLNLGNRFNLFHFNKTEKLASSIYFSSIFSIVQFKRNKRLNG